MPTFLTKNRQRIGRWNFKSKWGIPAVQDLEREPFQSSGQNALLLMHFLITAKEDRAESGVKPGYLASDPPFLTQGM